MKNRILLIPLSLLLAMSLIVTGCPPAVEIEPPLAAYELIDWNSPVPMTERLLADTWILPEGWQEATEGVEELVIFNSGSLTHDIATAINMERFEQKTGIRVKAIEVGGAHTFPKFLSVVVARDPSVHVGFIRAETEYSQVAAAGWAHPICELWPPEVQALYSPGLIDGLEWDGRFYGSVNIVQYYVLFYRPSWLEAAGVEEVPDTWEEVWDAAKKARAWAKENKGPAYFGYVFGATAAGHVHIAMLSSWLYSQGETKLIDGEWNLDTPEFRNAWNYLTGLITEDISDVAVLGYGWADYQKAFGMGKAAMMLGYSVYAVKLEHFPEVAGDWRAVPPPKWCAAQPEEHRIGYINFDVFMINNFAEDRYKAAAMLFLDYLRSKQASIYELVVEGNDAFLPAVYGIPDIEYRVDWDFATEVAKRIGAPLPVRAGITIPEVRKASAKTARIEAMPPGGVHLSDLLAEYLAKVVIEGMDSDEALDRLLAEFAEYKF